ncbi:MAG: hypothetical protein ACM3MF_01380 [Anaerolineae bacterium]
MSRWRLTTIVLIFLALALWGLILGSNLRPELGREVPRGLLPPPDPLALRGRLAALPAWLSSLELFITLLLAGVADLFLFPLRVRNMSRVLGEGWRRVLTLVLLGIGLALLTLVFAFGAAWARITFPFAILAATAVLVLAAWGFLAAAYTVGRTLLLKAGWGGLSPLVALALGLLLSLPLLRIPFVGGIMMVVYIGLGLGLVIATRFGSNEPWSLISLTEEENG